MTLNLNQVNCGQISDFINQTTYAVTCAVVFVLSVVSMVLQLTYFQSVSRMYKSIRQKYIDTEIDQFRKAGQNQKMSLQRIKTRNEKYMTQVSFKLKERESAFEFTPNQAQ